MTLMIVVFGFDIYRNHHPFDVVISNVIGRLIPLNIGTSVPLALFLATVYNDVCQNKQRSNHNLVTNVQGQGINHKHFRQNNCPF